MHERNKRKMVQAGVYIFLICFCNFQYCHGVVETFREGLFEKRGDCLDKIIGSAYRSGIFDAKTPTHCAQFCLNDTTCQSASFNNLQCHTGSFVVDSSCAFTELSNGGIIYEKKPVDNVPMTCVNGTLNGQTCVCDRCFAGSYCERPLIDCSEAEGDSTYTGWEGVCTIQPFLSDPFPVFCSFKYDGKGRTFIQRHYSVGNMFEKNWSEYKNGFGNVGGTDFWIGNERINGMTQARSYYLVVEMASSGWMEIFRQNYYGFMVQDENSLYAMTYSFTNGTMGDSLNHVKNAPFSTFDNDNDDASINCAQTRRSGFWFLGGQCGDANPNGVIQQTGNGLTNGIDEEVIWTYDRGTWSPWFVQMWFQRNT